MERELRKVPKVRVLNRREMLMLIGGTSALALFERANGQVVSSRPQTVAGCVVSPQQTEGPFFVDEKLNRSDIRTDPTDKRVRPGVVLHLTLYVFQVGNQDCKPLSEATVDIWHCDALGVYSDVLDREGDTARKKIPARVSGDGRQRPG
jgi:protocatechuate 3,4-dioxygenase beta subunit